MLRVVFFGSAEGTFSNRHFAALLEAPCEVAAAVATPPSGLKSTNARPESGQSFVEYGQEHGIPVYAPAKPNAPEFVEMLRGLQPDLFLAVGYLPRFREALLGVPRLLTANFHASLLPAYRGLHPVFRTLRGGERWGGLTVHVVDAGLDTGDILYQVRVRTRRDDSVTSLYDRIMVRSLPLVGRLITDAEAGRLRRRPQPAEGASYFSALTEADFRLDWRRPAEPLRLWICTTSGRCFFEGRHGRVYVLDGEIARRSGNRPGEVIRLGRTRCTVAAGDGALSVSRVQTEAGVWSAARWCREQGLREGDLLG